MTNFGNRGFPQNPRSYPIVALTVSAGLAALTWWQSHGDWNLTVAAFSATGGILGGGRAITRRGGKDADEDDQTGDSGNSPRHPAA